MNPKISVYENSSNTLELTQLKAENEFLKHELVEQRNIFESMLGKEKFDLTLEIMLLKNQVEESFKEKKMILAFFDEKDSEKEQMVLKFTREIDELKEIIEDSVSDKLDYNEETKACHSEIERLEDELKNRKRDLRRSAREMKAMESQKDYLMTECVQQKQAMKRLESKNQKLLDHMTATSEGYQRLSRNNENLLKVSSCDLVIFNIKSTFRRMHC